MGLCDGRGLEQHVHEPQHAPVDRAAEGEGGDAGLGQLLAGFLQLLVGLRLASIPAELEQLLVVVDDLALEGERNPVEPALVVVGEGRSGRHERVVPPYCS